MIKFYQGIEAAEHGVGFAARRLALIEEHECLLSAISHSWFDGPVLSLPKGSPRMGLANKRQSIRFG